MSKKIKRLDKMTDEEFVEHMRQRKLNGASFPVVIDCFTFMRLSCNDKLTDDNGKLIKEGDRIKAWMPFIRLETYGVVEKDSSGLLCFVGDSGKENDKFTLIGVYPRMHFEIIEDKSED